MITYPTNPLLYVLTPWTDSVTQTSWKWVVRGESGKWARHVAGENTASILTKLAPGSGGTGTVGPEYLPDALSGGIVPFSSPVSASHTTYMSKARITFTAITPGTVGNAITVAYSNPANLAATTVSVVGNALTVTLASKARMIVEGAPDWWGFNKICYYVGPNEYTSNGLPYATNVMNTAPHVRIRSNGTNWTIYGYSGLSNVEYQSEAVGQGSNPFPNGLMFSAPTVGNGFTPSVIAGVSAARQVMAAVNALGALVVATPASSDTGAVTYLAPTNLSGGSGFIVTGQFKGQLYKDTATDIWYRWDGVDWQEDYSAPPVTISATPPADTRTLWFQTSTAKLHVYYNDGWVATS